MNDTCPICCRPDGMTAEEICARLFIGVFPCGLAYSDRTIEVDHDYKRLAFLPFQTLNLEWRCNDCPPEIAAVIRSEEAQMQARRGQQYQVDASGHTVTLGK